MRSLTTPRLALREPRVEDAADALVMLQDPLVARWNPAPDVIDLGTAAAWCASGADWSSGTHATWHGVEPGTGRLIVNVSLFVIDADHRAAKVGYRVVPWQRGRGYATEALRAITTWAFDDLHLERIQLEHSVPNVASCHVAQRSGYRLEGTLRAAFRSTDGERHDDHVHGRLAADDPGW